MIRRPDPDTVWLTEEAINGLPSVTSRERRYAISDAARPWLYLVVGEQGRRRFIFCTPIGDWPEWSVEQARDAACHLETALATYRPPPHFKPNPWANWHPGQHRGRPFKHSPPLARPTRRDPEPTEAPMMAAE